MKFLCIKGSRIFRKFLQARQNPDLHLALQCFEGFGRTAAQFYRVTRRHSKPQFLDKPRQRDGAMRGNVAARLAHRFQIHAILQGLK